MIHDLRRNLTDSLFMKHHVNGRCSHILPSLLSLAGRGRSGFVLSFSRSLFHPMPSDARYAQLRCPVVRVYKYHTISFYRTLRYLFFLLSRL